MTDASNNTFMAGDKTAPTTDLVVDSPPPNDAAIPIGYEIPVVDRRTHQARYLARLKGSPVGLIGLTIIGIWIFVAVFAPFLSPYHPSAQDVAALADPTPSWKHWLGTDHLGRDIWSRVAWGSRTVLTLAPAALCVAYLAGCTLGLLAGYFGGLVDQLVTRTSDVILSFPVLVLYIVLISALGPSAFNIIVAITLGSAPGIGRIVRGVVLDLRDQEYVRAAQMSGESSIYIMFVELLPNARGPVIVDACLRMGYVTIKIGTLGFLGLGLPPPSPDWGTMVKDAAPMIFIWPHIALVPCTAISSLVIGFNFLADGIREMSLRD